MVYYFVGKREAEKLTGLSHETLKKLRLSGKLTEGADWVRQSSRSILYNAPLLLDFLQNRHDQAAHQRAIENYFHSLPSGQSKARGRRPS